MQTDYVNTEAFAASRADFYRCTLLADAFRNLQELLAEPHNVEDLVNGRF